MNKGLEALKVIYDLEDLQGGRDEFWKAYRIIEKELKALEIIKEKLSPLGRYTFLPMTQEEYELLKEVLL